MYWCVVGCSFVTCSSHVLTNHESTNLCQFSSQALRPTTVICDIEKKILLLIRRKDLQRTTIGTIYILESINIGWRELLLGAILDTFVQTFIKFECNTLLRLVYYQFTESVFICFDKKNVKNA